MKKFIKRLIFGADTREKKIAFGMASNIKMSIDFNHKSQRYLGLEEREVQSSFKRFATTSSIFVDIGASDGFYGLVYRKFNSTGEQFLCDADALYAQQQKDHFLMNGFALAKTNFVTKFISDHTSETHITLDSLLGSAAGSVFVKIDVDGGELLVLKGMEKVLTQRDCKIIVETHSKALEEDCIAYLQKLGYQTRILKNAWWRIFIPELRPIEHNRWFSAEKK